jgi:hypothetical protein
MPLSVNHKGQVLDFKYTKHQEDCVKFYIGDIFIGLIWKINNRYDTTIWHDVLGEGTLRFVSGFATRYDASVYMLYATGYWTRD